MADVTINALTRGTPAGSSILPYSTGSNTLGVPVSAILQNAGNIGIGTANPQARLDVSGSLYTNGYNHIESACLNITAATRNRIIGSVSGFVELGVTSTYGSSFISNSNVFQIVNTAPNYGLKILKTGTLKIDISQDIKTANSSTYCFVEIYNNNEQRGAHLRSQTGGNWDSLNASQILRVSQNDIISFNISSGSGLITDIDFNLWSYFNFMFWSN